MSRMFRFSSSALICILLINMRITEINCKRSGFSFLLVTFSLATGSHLFDRMIDYSESDAESQGNIDIPSVFKRSFNRSEWLSDDEYIKIDYLFVADSTFTEKFINKSETMEDYLGETMIKLQEMYDSLELGIKVEMSGIIKITKETEAELAPYLAYVAPPSHPNEVIGGWLLAEVGRFYTKFPNKLVENADVVVFITKRRLGRFDENEKFHQTMAGVAYVNTVCNNRYKYAVINDKETVQYVLVHESTHVLGCRDYPDQNVCPRTGLIGFSECCKRDLENMIKNRKSCVIEKYSEKSNDVNLTV